jgi:hypothetical protein
LSHENKYNLANVFDGSSVRFYEANISSGILVRFYGRKHPEIYADLSPTNLQEFLFPDANNRKIIKD